MDNKNTEATKLLKSFDIKQLGILHKIRSREDFKDLVSIMNHIIILDKEKSTGLFSDVVSVEDALRITSKGNFYRGRINIIVLFHALFKNAEREIEIREAKNG